MPPEPSPTRFAPAERASPRNVRLPVFQRSFSTKEPGRGRGTYSLKRLTERYLQGYVSFTTGPEEGTTFRPRCPLTLES